MKFVKFKLWVNKYTKNLKEKTYFEKNTCGIFYINPR